MAIDWFTIIRDLIVLTAGIFLIIQSRGKGVVWQAVVGWILVAMIVADVVIQYVRSK